MSALLHLAPAAVITLGAVALGIAMHVAKVRSLAKEHVR